jgi:hypothetical protein
MRKLNRPHVSLPSLALGFAAAVSQYGCEPEPRPAAASSGVSMDVPAAAGSQSPSLAVGADGTLALSWIEPDEGGHSLRYSVLDDATWSAPGSVARGDDWFVNWADFPSVVPISRSLWAAHWLVRQPSGGYAYDVFFSTSSDGATWADPVKPHDDGTPTEHGFVTIFPYNSGVGLLWLDGRNMSREPSPGAALAGMTLRSATYSGELELAGETVVDELVCDCCQTDVAITPRGAIAVYRDRTANEMRDVYAARFADGAWQAGHPVAADGWNIGGCPVNGPVIDADGDQVAVAWFTAARDEPKVRLARSADFGESFSAPVDVADGEIFGRVGLAMLGNGDVAVSWLCKEGESRAQVCLRRVSADDRHGPVQVLSGEQAVSPLSVPQLARIGDFLVAAWTVRDRSGSQIRSRRFAIDSLP